MSEKQPLVRIGVFDHEGNHLENARVRLRSEDARGEAHCVRWDRSRGCYVACGVAPGGYCLVAQAPGHDPSELRVEIEAAGLRTVILLGSAGLPFLFPRRAEKAC